MNNVPMNVNLLRSISISSFGEFSTDPLRPDYVCPAWLEMAPRWQLVEDLRAGTDAIREKAGYYLPRFEAETAVDWAARVSMTFVDDAYARTLVDHTGLIFAQPPKLGDDVPERLKTILEDVDGEGDHIEVFAQTVLDSALHLGHSAVLTDYPPAEGLNHGHELAGIARPYAILYKAPDIRSWQVAVVGGVSVIVQVMLREVCTAPAGDYGVANVERFREFRQAVTIDEATGRATSLGTITWKVWERQNSADGKASNLVPKGEGTLIGPKRIPLRVIYGGEKLGTLHTKPHLYGLAMKNIEETQVQSDYASVMHKCNVPTPVFIGRQTSQNPGEQKIQMGQGIDIPIGGDAKMLEPAGTALGATRQRLEDIREAISRQGANTGDQTYRTLTATEAALIAKQRNAKLVRAARSEQDAFEGMLADMADFLKISEGGGSIHVNQDFTGVTLDPAYLTVLVTAFDKGAVPLDALMYALQNGKLPDDFAEEDAALRLIAAEKARQDAAAAAPPPPTMPPGGEPQPQQVAA